jgi:hypothetical protein
MPTAATPFFMQMPAFPPPMFGFMPPPPPPLPFPQPPTVCFIYIIELKLPV